GAELLERVEVRVRPEQVNVTARDQLRQALLALLALGAGLREARRENHREARFALQHFLERVLGAPGEDDRKVEIAGYIEDRAIATVSEHRLVLGMYRIERRAVRPCPLIELPCHRGVRFGRLL